MIVTLVFLGVFLHIDSVQGTCYNYLTDIESLYFSGELTTTKYSCQGVCNKYTEIASHYNVSSIQYKESIILNNLCFCTTVDILENDYSVSTCTNSNCDSISEPCNFEGFLYKYNFYEAINIVNYGNYIVDQPARLRVETGKKVDKITYDFGDGYNETSTDMFVDHTYHTPGHFLFQFNMQDQSASIETAETMIFVSSMANKSSSMLEGPPAIQTSETSMYDLDIIEGSNIKFKIKQVYERTDGSIAEEDEEEVFSDVLIQVFWLY